VTLPPTIAVAIPAYNEADGIASFIAELDVVLDAVASDHVFVVVDDCSTDDTVGVLRELGARLTGGMVVVESERNRGHGPTVVDAYRRALRERTDAVLQVDGDGQFHASDVTRLVDRFAAGDDVVTGRRIDRNEPWFRSVVTLGLRWMLRLGFGVRRIDANCPFRLYRHDVLAALLAALPDEPLVPNVELTVLETRRGLQTAEIPVQHLPRRGTVRTGTMWRGRTAFSAPLRLTRFCVLALREVAGFRRGL
jgi:glycosyltransferase involved in cell wall biosynthesis